MRAYLDHNASAPLGAEARDAMLAALGMCGNASSVHAEGRAARAIVEKARRQYKQIYPCHSRQDLGDCFTMENNRIMFWFNCEDRSTRVLTAELGGALEA